MTGRDGPVRGGNPPDAPEAARAAAAVQAVPDRGDTAQPGDTPHPAGPDSTHAPEAARAAPAVQTVPVRGGTAQPGDTPDPAGPVPPHAPHAPQAAHTAAAVQDQSAGAGQGGEPDATGHFGPYGGRFAPEALMAALDELTAAYRDAKRDMRFQAELDHLLRTYAGRPTPLTEAPRLGAHAGGCRIVLKREDLAHTGSHKINNVLGQALLARRMGKSRVIAETGAGQHGVATATACALLGLDCVVYMGEEDTRRQALNVARMRMLGAEVVSVRIGSRTLKDAVNEAFRDWVSTVKHTHYCIGSVMGPHPFPVMVRDFQRVIGIEARRQVLELTGRLPDAVVACVGGGSNAIGAFHAFIPDAGVRLIGCEAGGEGTATGRHAATLVGGSVGIIHGMRTYLLQDSDGQTLETHSVSAGLDYPGVGPEHAWLRHTGRAAYRAITDRQAMDAFLLLSHTEGIIPALETAHALAGAVEIGRELGPAGLVLVNLSGRGDKDVDTAARWLGLTAAGTGSQASAAATAGANAGAATGNGAGAATGRGDPAATGTGSGATTGKDGGVRP